MHKVAKLRLQTMMQSLNRFGQVRTGSNRVINYCFSSNLELNHRFGPTPFPNFEPNFGQVLKSSGSNRGSEPGIPTSTESSHDYKFCSPRHLRNIRENYKRTNRN